MEFIEDEREQCSVTVFGDEVFLNYFDVEQDENALRINVKNPSGSEERWEKYDRIDIGKFAEDSFMIYEKSCGAVVFTLINNEIIKQTIFNLSKK